MKPHAFFPIQRKYFLVLALIVVTAACAGFEKQRRPAAVPEVRPGILAGYLQPEMLPNSLGLLPPPPMEGSPAFALDEAISRESSELRNTPRWDLAAQDAELSFPDAAGTFSCALGIPITEHDTPYLYMLLRRTLADAGLSTYRAKTHYRRERPFMQNSTPTCTPDWEAHLGKDGSYPSGHTAIGWAWALILSEVAPDRADAIIVRGRAYGESRIVCNVHWHSDVVEGRFMGASAVARLHADPAFRSDLEAAKAEYAALRAQGLEPVRDCRSEAVALAYHWQNLNGEAQILLSWQGVYPVEHLDLLPLDQRDQAVGYIDGAGTFDKVWKAFKPDEALPTVDFNTHLVLFVRNTQFYNRTAIGKVKVGFGIAEVIAMETLSARPIEDKAAMAMVLVSREGITAVQSRDSIIPIPRRR